MLVVYSYLNSMIMDKSLTNELLQLQRSRCGFKYADFLDDYVEKIKKVYKVKSVN